VVKTYVLQQLTAELLKHFIQVRFAV